jgi:hypothetical protein
MRIDEAWGNRQAIDVERSHRGTGQPSDFGDLAADNRNVSVIAGQPRAIIKSTASKQEIVHGVLLFHPVGSKFKVQCSTFSIRDEPHGHNPEL